MSKDFLKKVKRLAHQKRKLFGVSAFLVLLIGSGFLYHQLTKPMSPYGKRRSDVALWIQNEIKLRELHPVFRNRIRIILSELKAKGLRPRIAGAWRSSKSQANAVKAGASSVKFGFHNVTAPDGNKKAWACDIVDDNKARVTNPKFFFPLAKIAEAHGMTTGIRWGLSKPDTALVELSIEKEDWAGTTTMRTGWDPAHVQPIGITAEDAQAGNIENAFKREHGPPFHGNR